MADSVRKQIADFLIARLAGNQATPRPAALGNPAINKNRSVPVGKDELPMYSLYFVHNVPAPVGDKYRPTLKKHSLTFEVRVITAGTDDAADQHCQWVTQQINSADRIVVNGVDLALGIMEADTPFEPLQGAAAEFTVTRMRWVVEYTTNPIDITKTK